MIIHNRTVFEIPLTWNRTQFESTRNKYQVARRLIKFSINVQFEKQLKGVFSRNIEIDENINESNQRLLKCHDKLRVLDNMIELASQSLRIYFDNRMMNVRAIIKEHCGAIQEIIREEADHWKEIHAVMDQHLLNPGDIRSRSKFPKTVQKSPASNIATIEEEESDDKQHVSKLLNGNTLTPLLTQMIRKSRLQSNKCQISIDQENSVFRKENQSDIHIIPLSASREPLDFIDTTFVVKPEDTLIYGGDDDEPNGTYRAHPHHRQPDQETSPVDSQPHIPARLCFSPTILQEATLVSEENDANDERFKTIVVPIGQNRLRTNDMQKPLDDIRRFGQTFLLDNVKTERIDEEQTIYIRPQIPDDDVLIINHIKPTNNDLRPTEKPKIRSRMAVKPKSQPVIVSARKTRSATKVIAEQEAASRKTSTKSSVESRRKTRKRKPSKSVERRTGDSSDDESQSTTSRRKTKRRRRSKTERQPEIADVKEDKRKTTRKNIVREQEPVENEIREKRKKTKVTTNDNEEKQTKNKKRKVKTKKTTKKNDDTVVDNEEPPPPPPSKSSRTRSTSKRNR